MADPHLCQCSTGPHADLPVTVLDPGALLVVRDPSSLVRPDDIERALDGWHVRQGLRVVVLHGDITLQFLSDEDLDSIGLVRRAALPIGPEPDDD